MSTTTIKKASKNPHVQAAAVELLAVNLKCTDVTDEYGEEAGQVIADCFSTMGLSEEQSPRAKTDAATEAIQELSTKMEAALVKARLLRSDCAEARQSQRKAA